MHTFLIILAMLVLLGGAFFSVFIIRVQKNRELDRGLNPISIKHPLLANPILISYVLFPIVLLILVVIALYYF